MRTFVLTLLLLLVATAAAVSAKLPPHKFIKYAPRPTKAKVELCLPKSFIFDVFAIASTRNRYDGLGTLYFDMPNERIRMDSKLLDPVQRSHIFWALFGKDQRKFYAYCPVRKICRSFSIPEKCSLKQLCLPPSLTKKRPQSIRVGKSLKTDTFVVHNECGASDAECRHHGAEYAEITVEPVKGPNAERDPSCTKNLGVPLFIRQWGGRLGNGNHFSQIRNFEDFENKGLEDKFFELPEECKKGHPNLIEHAYYNPLVEDDTPLGPWLFNELFGKLV